MTGAAGAALVTAWTLFAFGAVYPWASRPAVAASLALLAHVRPTVFRDRTAAVDAALAALIGYVWLQALPLPPALVAMLSPANGTTLADLSLAFDPARWRPLSLAPAATIETAAMVTGAVALHWVVREGVGPSGVRWIVRSLALSGALAVLLAVLRPMLFPNGLMYGVWLPVAPEATPLGPIISRNHFAAWMLVAAPVVTGYLFAHGATHWAVRSRRSFLARILIDARALWITTAVGLMVFAVVFSQSRAGLIGLIVAGAFHLVSTWRSAGPKARALLVVGTAGLALSVLLVANPVNVLHRLGHDADDWGGRPTIWQVALEMGRQFPVTGVGLGAFESIAPVFQPKPVVVFFNHAHSQYLQWWAEGGAIGVLLALWLVAAAAAVLTSRARRDPSALGHVRFGALAGLIGLAVQCVWETPLVTPAVLWLTGLVSGVAMRQQPVPDATEDGR